MFEEKIAALNEQYEEKMAVIRISKKSFDEWLDQQL